MTDVRVDMDGMSGSERGPGCLALPDPTIVEVFGFRVEERVFLNWSPGVHKLVWNFGPISRCLLEVEKGDGPNRRTVTVKSQLCHIEYSDGELEQARDKVRAKFIETYRLDKDGPYAQ
jgi:hypothetical protein